MSTVKRWDYYLLDDGHCSPMREISPGCTAHATAGWVMRSDHEAEVARLEKELKEARGDTQQPDLKLASTSPTISALGVGIGFFAGER